MDQLAFFGWYLLFCLVFNLLDHLVFFDDVSKFWVFAQVISGKNGVLASFVFFAFFSTSSKRRHFHYETSLQCVMWLQQKQLMVLTVLQLLKSKWFFSTNLAPAIWKRRFSLLQALSQLIDPRLQESNDTAVWQFWYHIKPWITSYFHALSRSVIDFQYFSAYQNISTFKRNNFNSFLEQKWMVAKAQNRMEY